jgi:hypothetical protein
MGDSSCTICRGAGIIMNPGGLSCRSCECYLRKLNQKRNIRDNDAGTVV